MPSPVGLGDGLGVVLGVLVGDALGAGDVLGDGDGLGDGDVLGEDVGVGEALGDGLGEDVGVGVGSVDGFGEGDLPELHVTEFPSAERTQTICEPVLVALGDGAGAEADVDGTGDGVAVRTVVVGAGDVVVRRIVTGCPPADGGMTTRTDFTVVCPFVLRAPGRVAGAVVVFVPSVLDVGDGLDCARPAFDAGAGAAGEPLGVVETAVAAPVGVANAATDPPMGVTAMASDTTRVRMGCMPRRTLP